MNDLITSRDNPRLKALRRMIQDPQAYRKQNQVWLEGDHLCRSAQAQGVLPRVAVFSQTLWLREGAQWADCAPETWVLTDDLFASLSSLESPAEMGWLLELPAAAKLAVDAPSVVLDRLQDAGNVGAILRSAAAFGFRQVIALKGTAALWSPKVLRSAMGAHFGLDLIESASADSLDLLQIPLVCTDVHAGPYLHELQRAAQLPSLCAWVMGNEGQGITPALLARADLRVRIAQPGGQESLNVATAAAICLHASATAAL